MRWLIELEKASTYDGNWILKCIHEGMDGYDCDIESEACYRAEKMKECWISMVALNDMLLFPLILREQACSDLRCIWSQAMDNDDLDKRWAKILRLNRGMKICTHF